nr:hypothetical protein [Tanacetum cinerariifolium]
MGLAIEPKGYSNSAAPANTLNRGLCPILVHGLERGTSGIVLCANTKITVWEENVASTNLCVWPYWHLSV